MPKPGGSYLPACYSDSEDSSDDYGYGDCEKSSRRTYRKNVAPVVNRINYQDEFRKETAANNLDGVKAAFSHGVVVDQVTSDGFNALMTACHMVHVEIVEFLLEVGANPNFQNRELFTPLMVLCFSDNENEEQLLRCAKILVNNEVNINAADTHGTTSLMYASKCGHASIVKELLTHGVNLNVQDSQGWTAIFWAVNRGHFPVVKHLVEAGARKKLRDCRGRIAYDLAYGRKGKEDIATILCPKKLRFELLDEVVDLVEHTSHLSDNIDTEVGNLLASIKKYDDIHTERKMDKNVLNLYSFLTTTDEALVSCGIKYPWHRRQTLEFIKELHLESWIREEPLNKGRFSKTAKSETATSLTYLNAAHLLVALQERLVFIQASAAYLQKQWCSAVESASTTVTAADVNANMMLFQEIASAASLLEICHCKVLSIIQTIDITYSVVNDADSTEIIPSDLLMEKIEQKSNSVLKSVMRWAPIFVIVGFIVWKKP